MPVWIARLLWRVRGKRRVRIHFIDANPSLEGILAGRWGGHYILLTATLVRSPDESHTLEGSVEIPAERVLFLQVLR